MVNGLQACPGRSSVTFRGPGNAGPVAQRLNQETRVWGVLATRAHGALRPRLTL
jgi:hypothetical protein